MIIYLKYNQKKIEIEENFKTACTKLIQGWFLKHTVERKKFEFVNSHISDIVQKIIYEGKYKEILDEMFINGSFLSQSSDDKYHNNNCIDNNSSNNNNDNFNINYNRSYNRSCNRNYTRSYNRHYYNYSSSKSYSYYSDESFDFDDKGKDYLSSSNSSKNISLNNNISTIPETLKKYYLAQAYVFEDLTNSNLFKQIDWKNRVNNINEEGEEVSLLNKNKYKIKKSDFPFDITVISNQNKTTNIIVQVLNDKRYNYLKLKCTVNQWNLFNNEENEQNISIMALVKFQLNNTPDIYYIKKSNLNEII